MCYAEEMMTAFISALDAAVQEEFDVAAQVSDEEWEAIRPTKLQRRDLLLKHMTVEITSLRIRQRQQNAISFILTHPLPPLVHLH